MCSSTTQGASCAMNSVSFCGWVGSWCASCVVSSWRNASRPRPSFFAGTCEVRGTPRADVIEGSPREGDIILGLAGNDQIHANDGHTDTVSCGPGRDTVWADRTDRLSGCEIVHR